MPSERIQRRIEALLDEADAAVGASDWAAVVAKARAVLAIDETNPDALAFLKMAETNARQGTGRPGDGLPEAPSRPPSAHGQQHPAPLPPAFAGGRYRILRVLGEGGRKRVYLAHDERLGRDVALAVVKTEGLDPGGLERVQREARAMARLGDHHGIVTVHDVGEEDGRPYIVSQYMEGGTLADLLESTDGHRLDLPAVLRIADEVSAALAHAHDRGIVHRDLKPSNVFLTKDRSSRLGDFGLARVQDRSHLTVEGMMVGTFAYMPPEQAMGQPADARSDLYSLGCVLYELVSGRPPFVGDDAVAVATQHLNTPPVAPSWHSPEMPRALEALILRLLAKVPDERPESAAAVRQALAAIAAARPASSEGVVQAEANPLDRLAGGVFVGREREMDRLRAALEEALAGHGRLLTLVGEPGIGKTRTALELATYARLRDAQVLWGRCREGEGAPPYWPWVQVIRSYVHERDPKALASDMGPGAADIAEVVSEVRERLPGLPLAPALEPEQARFRLFDSITTFLKNASKRQPLLLILDDLHWADKATLLLLLFLARELGEGRILVLGTYRDVELGRQHPLAQTLGELAREQLSERVLLRGLGEPDVARFIEMTAGLKPPERLVAAVYRETEGNPFFVNEVVRLLVSDGRLEHPETAESWSVAVPQGVKEVIGRRLDSLSAECNRALSVAAVLGREFALEALERVGEVKGERLLEALEEAAGARVLAEVPGAVGRYSFSHALIWETLYGELSATRRVRLHQRIGDELEALYGERAEEHAAELAYHYGQAAPGGPEKLVRYATLAGKRAARQYAHEEAAAHFRAALAAKDGQPVDAETADLLVLLGQSLVALNRPADGWQSLVQAFEYYAGAGSVPEAIIRAMMSHWGFFGPETTRLLERALPLAPDDSPERGMIQASLGYLVGNQGNRARGRELIARASDRARERGDRRLELMARRAEAGLEMSEGQLALARAAILAVLDLAGELDDPATALEAHFNLCVCSLLLLDLDAARRHADADVELAERLRLRDGLIQARYAQGQCAFVRGDWDEALAAYQAALKAGPADHRPLDGLMRTNLLRGDFEEADRWRRRFEDAVTAMPVITAAWLSETLAVEASATGDAVLAERAREVWERADLALFDAFSRWQTHNALGLLALMDGNAADADRAFTTLQAFSGWHDTDRLLGNLAGVMGRFDEAIGHFEQALAFSKAGSRPFYALATCDLAQVLVERDASGDRDRSRGLLDESLALARELGMRPLLEKALALKMELQGIDPHSNEASIDAVTATLERERPDLRPQAAPDGTVTIMFTDIEGSTALNVELGDDRWMNLLGEHNALVRRCLAAHGGFEVKTEGDAFMAAFGSARKGLRCAQAIQRAFAEVDQRAASSEQRAPAPPGEPWPPTAAGQPPRPIPSDGREPRADPARSTVLGARSTWPIRVRIGLHTGEPVRQGDDFYGTHVVLASRIAAQAVGGEILVSTLLRELVAASGEFAFDEGREVELKGLPGRQRVHPVLWTQGHP